MLKRFFLFFYSISILYSCTNDTRTSSSSPSSEEFSPEQMVDTYLTQIDSLNKAIEQFGDASTQVMSNFTDSTLKLLDNPSVDAAEMKRITDQLSLEKQEKLEEISAQKDALFDEKERLTDEIFAKVRAILKEREKLNQSTIDRLEALLNQ